MPSHFDPRRRLLAGAALLGGSGLLTRAAQATAAEQVLQIVGPWEITGLSPLVSGYLYLRLQIAETLLDVANDGSAAPGLAARWEVSPDGLLWRFSLRDDALFHDGTPVRADAVARSLQAALRAPAPLSQAGIARIAALDARQLEIQLNAPMAALPALLAHGSALVLAPSSYDAKGQVQRIVGSGPYRVRRLQLPQSIEAEWFEGASGAAPAVRALHYLAAGRAETRVLMCESGQADLAFALDPASVARVRRHGRVRLSSVTLPRVLALKVNAGDAALRSPAVRQALSLAIDRAGIAKALLRDPEMAASQLFPPEMAGWHTPGVAPLQSNLALAHQHLAEAGWQRQGEHWVDASGRPLRLTLRTFPDRPELPLVATALQEQWRQLGVPVRVAIGNSGDIPLGHRDGSLQLALIARSYGTVPDPSATLLQDFGPAGGDWGAMGWHDNAVEQALRRLLAAPLPADERLALRRRVASRLHQALPLIPIAWYRLQVGVSARLDGVRLDPLERSYRLTEMRWRSPT